MKDLIIPLDLKLVAEIASGTSFNKVVFIDEVTDWCTLNKITPLPYLKREVSDLFSTFEVGARFENDNDALLFKLRWL